MWQEIARLILGPSPAQTLKHASLPFAGGGSPAVALATHSWPASQIGLASPASHRVKMKLQVWRTSILHAGDGEKCEVQ